MGLGGRAWAYRLGHSVELPTWQRKVQGVCQNARGGGMSTTLPGSRWSSLFGHESCRGCAEIARGAASGRRLLRIRRSSHMGAQNAGGACRNVGGMWATLLGSLVGRSLRVRNARGGRRNCVGDGMWTTPLVPSVELPYVVTKCVRGVPKALGERHVDDAIFCQGQETRDECVEIVWGRASGRRLLGPSAEPPMWATKSVWGAPKRPGERCVDDAS